jgi:hypothetical protein
MIFSQPTLIASNPMEILMRKLILIAVISMISKTPCYANLSLASNDPTSSTVIEKPNAPIEQPKAHSRESRPESVAKPPSAATHSKKRYFVAPDYQVRGLYHHCL